MDEVLDKLSAQEKCSLELLSKWGCDGSQQVQFKQKFHNEMDACDKNIFQSSFVPLRLRTNINGVKYIVWQNPVPSSPRYCRPIRIRFVRETNDITNEEIEYVENQIKTLMKTEVPTSRGVLHIKHFMSPTMVDATVCNAATSTSSTMRCYICRETITKFNNLSLGKEENPESLKFGLSILHARIRLFESLLHLSYKLPISKWQARSDADKEIVSERKKVIQQSLKEEMGLLVDIPKAGFGNTNDGNTSRRFFADIETSARITGLDIDLIRNFKVIIEAISSGYTIDMDKFSMYAMEAAKVGVTYIGR